MSTKRAADRAVAIPDQGLGVEYARAMAGLRASNAARPHTDRHAEARKGFGKGGRAGSKAAIQRDDD